MRTMPLLTSSCIASITLSLTPLGSILVVFLFLLGFKRFIILNYFSLSLWKGDISAFLMNIFKRFIVYFTYMAKENQVGKYYFLLLLVHGLHLIEEVFGNAYFIEAVYGGIQNFLIVNIILLIIPAVLFYFVSKRQKIAVYLAFAYP